MTRPRARRFLPFALLLAVLAVLYFPLLAGQILFQRDISRWTFPSRWFLRDALVRGDSMLWNPLLGLGLATPANPLNQLAYPLNAAFFFSSSPQLTSWWLLLHLVIGGVGIMMLARALGVRSIAGTLVAGVAWCLSGVCTGEFTAGLRLVAGAYLPWCGLGFIHLARMVRTRSNIDARLGALALAAIPVALAFLTGEVFVASMAVGFGLAVTLADGNRGAVEPDGRARRATRFGASATLSLVLAAGIAAVALVPAHRIAQGNARGNRLSRSIAEVGSFHPLRLLELVAPGSMGDPYADYVAAPWVGEKDLDHRPLGYGCYLGASVMVLASLAFGRRRLAPLILGMIALLALLLAMGRHTPAHAIFRTLLPPLALMRGPEKYLIITVASSSLLAALGLERLFSGEVWLRSIFCAIPLGLLALWLPFVPVAMAESVRHGALAGLAAALAMAATSWLARRRPRLATALAVTLVTGDLAAAAWPLQNFGSSRLLAEVAPAAVAIRADARARVLFAPPRVHRSPDVDSSIERSAPPRTVGEVQRNLLRTLIDNLATVQGIGVVPGYDAAMPRSLGTLWTAGQRHVSSLLRLTGVDYLVTGIGAPSAPTPDGLDALMDPLPGTRLFRVKGVLPRVYLAGAIRILPDQAAREAVFDPEVVAGRRAILAPNPQPPTFPFDAEPVEQNVGVCELESFHNARIMARCQATRPGVAVFLEQFDAGWTAWLDGQPTQILRVNLAMRGVFVLPGSHRIVLSYAPPGWKLGLTLSAISLLLLLALLVAPRVHKSSATPT
ncbi:MAG: YfhO family protein [Polyangia bacterium]